MEELLNPGYDGVKHSHSLSKYPSKAQNNLKNENVPDNHLRCVCISDTHGKHEKLPIPPGDILLCAGDISSYGLIAEIHEFNVFLGSLPHKHKVVIAGNHDFCLEKSLDEAKSYLSNAIYLQDSGVDIEGIKIYGTPWIPVFGAWAFSKPRGECLLAKWNKIPTGIDILLTHSPPIGYGDRIFSGKHVGCVDLLHSVQRRIRPQFHVFGHIHEAYGTTSDGRTTFINCSVCDLRYSAVNSPIVFDIAKPGTSK